jgi:hypothetical protein
MQREREILEHAVHAVTEQAAKADDLVDEASTPDLPGAGTRRPVWCPRS